MKINNIIYELVISYPTAIVVILYGIYRLKKIYKSRFEDDNYMSYEIFMNDIISSIGLLIFGVLIILFKTKII